MASAQEPPASAPLEQSIGKATPEIFDAKAAPSVPDYRTVVTSDFGGSVIEYIEKYNRWRQEGRKVRVDDDCMSACTFMIGRLLPQNVCVGPVAKFAFHSAYQMSFAGPVFAKEATRLMWEYYPPELKEMLVQRGWEGGEHPDFIYINGDEIYDRC